MKRTHVLLTEKQQQEIKRIAAAESISAGAVIRRLIDRGSSDDSRAAMRIAAEKMVSYYSDEKDPSFCGVDPWKPEELAGDAISEGER